MVCLGCVHMSAAITIQGRKVKYLWIFIQNLNIHSYLQDCHKNSNLKLSYFWHLLKLMFWQTSALYSPQEIAIVGFLFQFHHVTVVVYFPYIRWRGSTWYWECCCSPYNVFWGYQSIRCHRKTRLKLEMGIIISSRCWALSPWK